MMERNTPESIEWENLSLIIVDDEEDLLNLLVDRFQRKGCFVEGYLSGIEAQKALQVRNLDIGIYDINLPQMSGVELLRWSKEVNPEMEILMLTGHGTVETAIETMKLGAYDYLRKPYALAELETMVSKAWEKKRLKEVNIGLRQALLNQALTTSGIMGVEQNFQIIGQSSGMKHLIELTRRLADSEIPVLIEGESGTGKELFAKALHIWGNRSGQPYIAINSGALPENLLEAELFGHVRGAFTGASQERKGLVEVADQGTLFLDEIGEMPLNLQVKLLRFLENGEFRRVGESRLRKVNVRMVTATNRILEREVAQGAFRQDLYYRLNVMKLTLPPLRERPEDISILVNHFLKRLSRGKSVKIAKEGMKALQSYPFPGNVRELSHMIERGIILAQGEEINVKDFLIPQPQGPGQRKEERLLSLNELEREHIERVMDYCKGNKTHAARILGVSVRHLYRKLDEYASNSIH
ncbi:sigma-54-dependent transcriptional regulator [Desulfosporosinus metallidurans]|uniref:Stage 0 sporulation protein A homolog n=1 Tax=Desulfosporosinus metallidurans TaxID=1888891 RepID=A0A1Q8QQB2_9FIRM|nr:sigma-54 dependent transcriptional regulator [Desulfosporosinus metallidurans]OLN29490.1 Response regulator of zinc sigma-54-dependent two-component system [Desulfosporosinus metallidurans]